MKQKQVLIISKSPSPPWNDSAKNIIKSILDNIKGFNIEYFSDGNTNFSKNHIEKQIYKRDTSYSLSLSQQLSFFLNLLKPDYRNSIYHYFFSPNMKSSIATSFIQRTKYQPSIQTVLSLPRNFKKHDIMFFGDEIVTMSDTAKLKLNRLGYENVTTIYPGVDIEEINKDEVLYQKNKFGIENDKLVILYAGDYNDSLYSYLEFIKEQEINNKNYKFIFAIREKSTEDKNRLYNLKRKIKQLGISRSFLKLYGEIEDFKSLLLASDVLIMTQTDLYAKMDIPLVVLEAMVYKKNIILFDNLFFNEINREENIFIIESFNELSIVLKNIEKLSIRIEMGLRNLNVAKKYFTNKLMVEKYEKIYKKLL
jgi:glycosyltransferase involved in cell wall biosynthesis